MYLIAKSEQTIEVFMKIDQRFLIVICLASIQLNKPNARMRPRMFHRDLLLYVKQITYTHTEMKMNML